MIEKLNILLFRPRFIAKFIADSYARIFLFFFIFIFMITGVRFLNDGVNNKLGQQNENLIIEHISNTLGENGQLSFVDNAIETNVNLSFFLGNVLIRIGYDEIDTRSTNVVINFLEDKVVIVYFGLNQVRKEYDNLNIHDFRFSNIIDGIFEDRINLIIFMDTIFNIFMDSYRPFLFFLHFFTVVYIFSIMVILIYIFSWRYGPQVRGSFRVKIILYSSIWILLMMLFQHLFLINQLMYLGLMISLIFARKSLSSVIKIKTYRK